MLSPAASSGREGTYQPFMTSSKKPFLSKTLAMDSGQIARPYSDGVLLLKALQDLE